jgi:hypothetical protein
MAYYTLLRLIYVIVAGITVGAAVIVVVVVSVF